jgi:tetratricopeptide (TPR) repeat protein
VDYGLLVQVGTGYEVSHPLIHIYARQELLVREEETHQQVLIERFVKVLAEHFPKVEYSNWARCEPLVPHIQACTSQLEQQRAFLAEAASLSHQAAAYLLARARYEQAEELFKRALTLREQVLEPDYVAISSSLDRLATLYRYQGRYEQAERLFQRALAIKEQALPPDHPDTATTLGNLAVLYRVQGRDGEAEPLYQRALAICEQALPPDHPNTATALENYAILLRVMNRPQEAQTLNQRAKAIRARRASQSTP